MIRLNKLLAERGLGARRKCDELIQSGAVQVNGTLVTEPGTQVEPGRDRVEVNGRPLPREAALRTYMLHKPVGVISTLSDPEGRRSLRDFMPAGARLFPVGRLDADTSGLLLLTNDGDLAHHLMHPRYGVAKRYRVHLDRMPSESQLKRLQDGVEFEPGVTSSPAQVWPREASGDEAVIEIAIHEGRHRQVRRMCEAVGLEVRRLHRYGYGPLKLGELARGLWRELSDEEIDELRSASARPAARAGGFTGQRSFDRPRVRPREDRIDRRPRGEESAGGGAPPSARRERGGPRARSDERPRRDREERRDHDWSHPPTQVWRAEDENREGGSEPRRGNDRGGRPARPRTGSFRPREGSGDRRPPRAQSGARPERGGFAPRSDRGGFERRPARSFERPAGDRGGSGRTARDRGGFTRDDRGRGGRPAAGGDRGRGPRTGFVRGGREGARPGAREGFRRGGEAGPGPGRRREGFGAGPRSGGSGGFAPRGGGRSGGFAPRGAGGSGFSPRGGGRGGGFAPRGGESSGFAPRPGGRSGGPARGAGGRSGGFAPRGGGPGSGFAPRGGGRSGGFAPRGRAGAPGEGASPARRRFERSTRPEASSRPGSGGFRPRGERGRAGGGPRGSAPGERRGARRSSGTSRPRPTRRPNS